MRAKKALILTAAAALASGPACRSAAPRPPQAPAATPEAVRGLAGQTLILRQRGDAKTLSLKRTQLASLSGECDVAVEVRTAAFDRGAARFTLEIIGRPRLARRGAHEERCGDDQPQMVLTVSGFAADSSSADLQTALGRLLQTPESYLRAHGVAFSPPAGTPAPPPAPDPRVSVPPARLLWADALRQDPARRVRHEGEVEIEGVVGLDGRLHGGRVVTPLSPEHEQSVLRVLPLWRFEPGRRGAEPVAARVRERMVFRIYY